MKVQYQIITEVEIEIDNPNDKVANNWTICNLASIAKTSFTKNNVTVGDVKVSRKGS